MAHSGEPAVSVTTSHRVAATRQRDEHAQRRALDGDTEEAKEQIAFADVLLLNKIDLVSERTLIS